MKKFILPIILAAFYIPSLTAAETPVVFKISEGVRPGTLLSLYGEFLTGEPTVIFYDADGKTLAAQKAVQTDSGGHFCRVIFPDIPPGVYRIAVETAAGISAQELFVNRPDPRWLSDDRAYPGLELKLIGRNLDAHEYNGTAETRIRLVPISGGEPVIIQPEVVNPYCVDFQIPYATPIKVKYGKYYVEVTTQFGQSSPDWVRLTNRSEYPETPSDTILEIEKVALNALACGVSWASDFNWKRRINVKDCGAAGDGETDDTAAIQESLDDLATTGGGLYFPPGEYLFSRITVPSNCMLAGYTQEKTTLISTAAGGFAIHLQGKQHGITSMTLRFHADVPADAQTYLIGGDAEKCFFCRVFFSLLRDPDVSTQHMPYYVKGPGPMLVRGCKFTKNLWNHEVRNRLTFRDNEIVMREGLGFCMSSEKLLFYRNTLRFDAAEYAGQMNGFFVNEGWMGWNIYNSYVAENVTRDLEGPGDCQPFASDSAWSCFAGPVTAATQNTVDARAELDANLRNLPKMEAVILIVSGRGLGQLRRVASHEIINPADGDTPAHVRITVSPAWDVPPDETSIISVGCWHLNNVFYKNTAIGSKSPYNMYYGGCYDCVDDRADSQNTEGWCNWGRIGDIPHFTAHNPLFDNKWHDPVYFSQLRRSRITGKAPEEYSPTESYNLLLPGPGTPERPVQRYSTGVMIRVENEIGRWIGIGEYGTELRDNEIDRHDCFDVPLRLTNRASAAIATYVHWPYFDGNVPETVAKSPLILGTLCDGNKIKNSALGFHLNLCTSLIIRGTIYENCPTPVVDNGFDTVIMPEEP